MKMIVPLLVLLTTTACQQEKNNMRMVASVGAEQPAVEQGEVWGPEEAAMMQTIGDIFKDTLIQSTGNAPMMRRDAHPKHHGCVQTKLQIDNSKLAEKLRVGIFKENKSYEGIIRFSNGDPNFEKADIDKDVRGMALKFFDTDEENYLQKIGVEEGPNVHDFVFMNTDGFFIANPSDYEDFMRATQGRFGVLSFLAFHWSSLRAILGARVTIANSLDIDYASATPYKLGDTSMKMKFKSCKGVKDQLPKRPSANFLGERLEETLKTSEGCFDFYVQPNLDPHRNDIENALLVWDERRSPMIKVGRLTIPKQTGFRSEARDLACEQLTFNPWRAPESMRPLGGVNRIRLEVYLNQFRLRDDYNKR